MVARIIPVQPFDLVIFGGTGDLAQRKIFPALFHRFCAGQIPLESRLIGVARREMTQTEYRQSIHDAIMTFNRQTTKKQALEKFLNLVCYAQVDLRGDDGWLALKAHLRDKMVRVFYYSVAPSLFTEISTRLTKFKLSQPKARIVVEKPFGHDLATAQALNKALAAQFSETQIYRIDHYLGKETVQNLMALRFGNLLFEPLWNAQYIDHIQITVAETVGIGTRGTYYNSSGAMRDMVQNHLMQLLCLIAMEPPAHFEPNAVRDEKLKVIRALARPKANEIIRAQYTPKGDMRGFLEELGTPSRTESYIALKTHIENWRWSNVPFYLRTGKRLSARTSEIAIVFKKLPHSIFGAQNEAFTNVLTIKLQPNEGMTLDVTIKEPGPGGMRLVDVPLDMTFAEALDGTMTTAPDAYERLIMDVVRGDQTLFMRGDEVEAAWGWTDPIIEEWEDHGTALYSYGAGSDGPDAATQMLARDNREWRKLS